MLLTITADVAGADLGYLLHKNPARLHTFELPFGKAHVFYPHLAENCSQAALLLDIDPVGLVRGTGKGGGDSALEQYVNDRPYVASSFLSVAIARIFGTAMSGRSKERQQLADKPLHFQVTLTSVPSRGGEPLLRDIFEPLGYVVDVQGYPLDEAFPEWGDSPYFRVQLSAECRLQELLAHLYVLIPVLDAEKHYWVGTDEVDKLLRRGEGWLRSHPHVETITRRYLRYDRKLTRAALAQVLDDDAGDPERTVTAHHAEEQQLESPLRLWEQRIESVVGALKAEGAATVT